MQWFRTKFEKQTSMLIKQTFNSGNQLLGMAQKQIDKDEDKIRRRCSRKNAFVQRQTSGAQQCS
jgi:hypothetical protein